MYRWLALLFLIFSIAGVSAEDEIPDVVNETSIDPPSDDDDEPSGISDEVLMMAAAVLGVCIIVAALIMRG
ncbi:MAG: hypothetical protein QF807_08125 [Candidatus Thalassarchaeaceae archaeon]|jgi:hypothetical protein|nr:hypothetical protein [Candidatus Thalassarchaeaceae archaeon]